MSTEYTDIDYGAYLDMLMHQSKEQDDHTGNGNALIVIIIMWIIILIAASQLIPG